MRDPGNSRLLIPADGFQDWKIVDDHNKPHHIRMRDGDVFALAGLRDRREGERENLESCRMKSLHERMPAIIALAHHDLWLDPRVTDKAEIMSYLNSAPSGRLVTQPISPWVNSPKHDDERCIEPAGDM
jgi:putative SOS response-associated peptidase YedK